jgi:hypothetical protein
MSCTLERSKDLRWTANVAANQNIPDGFVVADPDAPFILQAYKIIWRTGAQYLYKFTDFRGRPFMSQPLSTNEFPLSVDATQLGVGGLAMGVGQVAKLVVPERVVPPGEKILIQVQEINGVGPRLLKVVFIGRKAFAGA